MGILQSDTQSSLPGASALTAVTPQMDVPAASRLPGSTDTVRKS
jgi:hypothetical protein